MNFEQGCETKPILTLIAGLYKNTHHEIHKYMKHDNVWRISVLSNELTRAALIHFLNEAIIHSSWTSAGTTGGMKFT